MDEYFSSSWEFTESCDKSTEWSGWQANVKTFLSQSPYFRSELRNNSVNHYSTWCVKRVPEAKSIPQGFPSVYVMYKPVEQRHLFQVIDLANS